MIKTDRIYVAGHNGLVGSAIVKVLKSQGFSNILTRTRSELDLENCEAVSKFFWVEKPDHVFLAAAKVGGIYANDTYPADFIFRNLKIQNNVIDGAFKIGVKRLLFLGSSCIYPKISPQPLKEEYLLNGPLEPTNRPYAVAKIAGIEMCWSYNRQYKTKFLTAMPTNLYGPSDNFHSENSHVIPALIRRFHEAKVQGKNSVEVWGSGSPRREFLYSDDMAEACVHLMTLKSNDFDLLTAPERCPLINIGYGEDMTIRELVDKIIGVVGYKGTITRDLSKPDGTPQKLLDISKIKALGWLPRTNIDSGLEKAYAAFLNLENTRI